MFFLVALKIFTNKVLVTYGFAKMELFHSDGDGKDDSNVTVLFIKIHGILLLE